LNLWLQAPLPGTNATTAIRPDSDPAISGRIGRALRELHCLNVPANLTHAHADELSILQGLLQGVAEKKKSMAADITAVMEGVSSALGRFPTKSVTGIHRDFYPAQVLIAGDDKVAFVDFDLFCVGDPLIDVGNFVAHLKETALREYHDADALQHHESRFLTSYCGSAESVDDQAAAIDAHVLVSLARHIFISRRIAARKQITQPIIELCLRLIGEHQDRFHTTNAAL
jgi:aminoglycoside phosphotransferase (APT) family kinase protein